MNSKVPLTFVNANMKLAAVIAQYNAIITLFPRFGIALGFGDKTIREICTENHIPLPLFLIVCNVYCQKDYTPDVETLIACPVQDIIAYLKASHEEYLNYNFPHIESHMNQIVQDWDPKYKSLIIKFYTQYKEEVAQHFKFEEEEVFPYISRLASSQPFKAKSKFSHFDKQHGDIEDKLQDFINLLMKYIPANTRQRDMIDMLVDIFMLAEDIENHTIIEDKMLIPYIKYLENHVQ